MPPRKATFSRIEPAPRQKRLSSRRSLPLTHRRDSPPTLQKRQSTLTQIDYVRSSSSIAIPNSSDDDEDSEYEETQPKKRQRLSDVKQGKARDPGQSTLTQKWDWKAIEAARAAREDEEEDDESMVLGDEVDQVQIASPLQTRSKGRTQTRSELLLSAHLDSGPDSDSSPRPQKRVAFAASSDVDRISTRPKTANSTSNPKTPQRPRRLEIPSSETPSSLKLSQHSAKQHEAYDRSPLKERSSNVPSLMRSRSPADENHGDISKSQTLHQEAPINGQSQAQPWVATLALTPKKDPLSKRRQLQRVTTIQESDTSDMEIDLSPIQQNLKITEDLPRRQPVQRKRRSLQRVTTIGDSEENSSDLVAPDEVQPLYSNSVIGPSREISPAASQNGVAIAEILEGDDENVEAPPSEPAEIDLLPKRASQSTPPDLEDLLPFEKVDSDGFKVQDGDPRKPESNGGISNQTNDDLNTVAHDDDDEDDEDDKDYIEEETYPQTYDPVSAALERDAARYGRDTQYESDEEHADDEESVVAASDDGLVGEEHGEEVEVVPSSQPGEQRIRSSQEANALSTGESMVIVRAHASPGTVDDSGYSSQHGTEKASKIAPCLAHDTAPRPSQISTVDDTQSPRSRPNSAHGWTQKSAPAWAETLSSSPFPLPPGFAMRSQRRGGETQSSGLVDFSLPPPPPLFMSD